MKWNDCRTKLFEMMDKEEFNHFEAHKITLCMQLKNPVTGVIELHKFEYTAKNAENLLIKL